MLAKLARKQTGVAGQPYVGKNSTFKLTDSPKKRLKMLRNGNILKSQRSKGDTQ